MDYKLVISEHADELLDNLVYYLLYRLKNEQAARHLLDGIGGIYDRLETNPFQFPLSRDAYLANKGYHEAVVPSLYICRSLFRTSDQAAKLAKMNE